MNLKVGLILLILIKSANLLNKRKDCKCKGFGENFDENSTGNFRIVGGKNLSTNDLPFVTTIYRSYRIFLGFRGETNVLYRDLFVSAGSDHDLSSIVFNDKYTRQIVAVYTHPNFNYTKFYNGDNNKENDLSLIQVAKPFEFGPETNIFPACVIDEDVKYFKESILYTAGYGRVTPVIDLDELSVYKDIIQKDNLKLKLIRTQQIDNDLDCFNTCIVLRSSNGSACYGDSGGPLIEWRSGVGHAYRIGILSGGKPMLNENNVSFYCLPNSKNYFNLINFNMNWITEFIERDNMCMTKRWN